MDNNNRFIVVIAMNMDKLCRKSAGQTGERIRMKVWVSQGNS